MQRIQQKYYRGRNNGAMLIVLASALVMVLLMVLFFASVLKQEQDPDTDAERTLPISTETAEEPDTEKKEPAEKQTEAETEHQTEQHTEQQTERVTEAVTEKKESVVTEPPKKDDPPIVIPQYDEALLARVALPEGTAPDGYVDKLVFFGDSTTHGMKSYKVFGSRDTTQVWTPTSGTLALFRAMTDLIYNPVTGEEQQIGALAASVKPEYLIMTLGVNGVSMMDEDYFKEEYQNVVNAILKNSPDTKLILQSIYPVAKSYENQKSINNTKICAANEWIAEIADAYGLPYLNTYSALVGADGYLPESYQNGDGMHLNSEGFAVIMQYVKTHPCK